MSLIQRLGRELGNLMTENDDLDVDKETYPGLATLMVQLVTYCKVLLIHKPQPMENDSPSLTIQGYELSCLTCERS
jgi:hypothetical protein